jgi:hypothetical protein
MTLALLTGAVLAAQVALPLRIEQVGWLQGCWSLQDGDRRIEEQWLSPRADSMLGVGRTTRADRLIEYEMVLIRASGLQLAYETHPSAQAPALFMSSSVGEQSIVFENLKHDFPQRIGYERLSADRLLAWIDGTQNGQAKRIEYPYSRVACAGE